MSQEIVIHGRPDFADHSFGKTVAKKTPKYVNEVWAVLCGRCQGNEPIFTKGGGAKPGGPTPKEARARLGCAIEAAPERETELQDGE